MNLGSKLIVSSSGNAFMKSVLISVNSAPTDTYFLIYGFIMRRHHISSALFNEILKLCSPQNCLYWLDIGPLKQEIQSTIPQKVKGSNQNRRWLNWRFSLICNVVNVFAKMAVRHAKAIWLFCALSPCEGMRNQEKRNAPFFPKIEDTNEDRCSQKNPGNKTWYACAPLVPIQLSVSKVEYGERIF